jgi:diguanylate cyclase (GGDEF)-like protein
VRFDRHAASVGGVGVLLVRQLLVRQLLVRQLLVRILLVRILLVRVLLVDRFLVVTRNRARLIWAASTIGSAIAAVLLFTAVRALPAPSHRLPFLALVALFALTEVAVVHFDMGSQSHTFSLVEAPLVLGLVAERPFDLVLAWLCGAAVAKVCFRRQTPIKLVYNLMSFALEAVVAVLIFHSITGGRDLLAGSTFTGAFAATLASSTTAMLTVFVAVDLAEGRQPAAVLVQQLSFGLASAAVVTSTMLIGVVIYRTDVEAIWLLALPISGVYMAQWIFTRQVRDHRRLEFLRRSTQMVAALGTHDSPTSLLEQICHTLHCDVAALAYLPRDVPDSVAVSVFGPSSAERDAELVAKADHWDRWVELVPGRGPRRITSPADAYRLGTLIGHRGLRDAMVVPLFGDQSVIGYLAVGDRLGDVSTFGEDDLGILEMLERLVSIGLENGHLERSLEEAKALERQLEHRASHDPLTGLANRAMFADHLEQVMGRPHCPQLACLYIDLDNFKQVNDAHGHSVGDQLLVVSAQRLAGCLRDGDMAARLGGDELAVVAQVGAANSASEEAVALGHRILAALGRPAAIGAASITTSASIGIFPVHRGDSVQTVLESADEAMYSAKRAGKGRVALFEREVIDL